MSGDSRTTPPVERPWVAELPDALSVGIMLLDDQLRLQYANVAAQVLLGFSLRHSQGTAIASLLAGSQEFTALLQRALADGKVCAVHELVRSPLAALPASEVPAMVDVTVTPLDLRAVGTKW